MGKIFLVLIILFVSTILSAKENPYTQCSVPLKPTLPGSANPERLCPLCAPLALHSDILFDFR